MRPWSSTAAEKYKVNVPKVTINVKGPCHIENIVGGPSGRKDGTRNRNKMATAVDKACRDDGCTTSLTLGCRRDFIKAGIRINVCDWCKPFHKCERLSIDTVLLRQGKDHPNTCNK